MDIIDEFANGKSSDIPIHVIKKSARIISPFLAKHFNRSYIRIPTAVRRQYGGSTAAVRRQYGGSTAAVRRQYGGIYSQNNHSQKWF